MMQATLLRFHHFLDASGRKIHDIDAILHDATPRGWGLLMLGVDMLTQVLDMKSDSDTALTMHALVKAGIPTDREQCEFNLNGIYCCVRMQSCCLCVYDVCLCLCLYLITLSRCTDCSC